MRSRGFYFLLLVLFLIPGAASARQNQADEGKKPEKQGNVNMPAKAFENWQTLEDVKTGLQPSAPFLVQKDEEPDFVREIVRVQWRAADPIDLWIMRPKITGKVPVVLYLYSYPNENDQFRDDGWAKRATAEGFAAVGFATAMTGPRYHNRPMKQWFISELPEALGSSVHDVQLILNYLADRGDLDTDHVGMVGMGSGATIAILAAHADKRIKALDLLDPWGDWPDWLKESPVVPENERPKYITPEFLKSVAALDPVAYLPSLRIPRVRIRLQQTMSEPVTPKDSKERMASSLVDSRYLARYADPKVFMEAWKVDGLSGWTKHQLRAEIQVENRNAGLTPEYSASPRN